MPTISRETIRFTPKAKPFENVKQNNYGLYNSLRWRKYRAGYLQSHPLCVMCNEKGLIKPAYYLDHITPINQGGSTWDESNHQGLCKQCHASKSAKDGHNKTI